ncbi:MAG: hypothetical protein AB7G06_06365 [Bdellovibrionales bacterium]
MANQINLDALKAHVEATRAANPQKKADVEVGSDGRIHLNGVPVDEIGKTAEEIAAQNHERTRQHSFAFDELLDGFKAVADTIYPDQEKPEDITFFAFGGFAMLAGGSELRDNTSDADAVVHPHHHQIVVHKAAEEFARQKHWDMLWLNDSFTMAIDTVFMGDPASRDFLFQDTFTVVGKRGNRIHIKTPKPRFMLATKLFALRDGRSNDVTRKVKDDRPDIMNLMRVCGVYKPDDLVAVMQEYLPYMTSSFARHDMAIQCTLKFAMDNAFKLADLPVRKTGKRRMHYGNCIEP